jgi:ubiquinone/menaquinone biosynthesis C-methylase UbiE
MDHGKKCKNAKSHDETRMMIAHGIRQRRASAWLCITLATGFLVAIALLPHVACGQTPTTQSATLEEGNSALAPMTHYQGREIAQTMHYLGAPWLLRESRQREEDCETMLNQLRLKPGMTVCDLGCGNGFYTLHMAALVGPQGKVLAVDIQPEMLRLMEARAADADLHNIESILGTLTDPRLPAGSLDLILLVDVYHELSHPPQILAAMRRALKPDGVVALVEFRAEDPNVPIKPLHKMSKQQILKEWRPNGFRLAREFDELPWQHMMFFAAEHPDR